MSAYTITGTGQSLFTAYNGDGGARPLSGVLLYQSATQFGLVNEDGSRTYVYGTGFAWDKATGKFTAGTVTSIAHYDASGAYVDDLANVTSVSVKDLQAALEASAILPSDGLSALLLAGDDRLDARWLASGGAQLNGYTGNDWLRGSTAADSLFGGDGNDTLQGIAGDDLIFGNQGNDRLNGGDGNDVIYGDSTDLRLPGGDDLLRGGLGNDSLYAGSGNNRLYGQGGDDYLRGSSSFDLMTGGKGADSFDYSPFAEAPRPLIIGWGEDTITDFKAGSDHLILGSIDVASLTWANDDDGNAVLSAGEFDSITFLGIDANVTALTSLLA